MFVNGEMLKSEINWYNGLNSKHRTIAWISGGVASAVACILAANQFDNIHFAFCDTHIESPDTYRFIADLEKVLGAKIHFYESDEFYDPESVWDKFIGLNFANGAPCSTYLKREVRTKQVQKINTDYCQIFGFDNRKAEINRAVNMVSNYPEINPKFPLIEYAMGRPEIFKTLKQLNIKAPIAYKDFNNNNCLGAPDSPKGGCVQGGIGYWQKINEKYPLKYEFMANKEHELSSRKGKPITVCKDQRKSTNGNRLFLKFNPEFPNIGTIDEIKGRQPVGYFECNGFCGTR